MSVSKENKIAFGPAGNSNSFYAEGNKSTYQMPPWIAAKGLTAFEYSFGRGVNLRTETAEKIAEAAKEHGIAMSAHAPYYINFASENPESISNSFMYVLKSLEALKSLGGRRLVFHTGSASKSDRAEAFHRTKENLLLLAEKVKEAGYGDMLLCPETMGKDSQIGTAEEVAGLVALDGIFAPCIDFGHVNSLMRGGLKTKEDYRKVLDLFYRIAGKEKTDNMHIHFSKIQYGNSGEIRHLTLEDTKYGPPYEPLMELLFEYKMTPVVISESDGVMAEDAVTMKNYFDRLSAGKN